MTSAEASRAYAREGFCVITPDLKMRNLLAESPLPPVTSNSVPLLSEKEIASVLSILYKREPMWAQRPTS